MDAILLLFISVLPVFLIGLFIYTKDKNKEPTGLLVKLFFGGLGSCILTLILSIILNFFYPVFVTDESSMTLIDLLFYS